MYLETVSKTTRRQPVAPNPAATAIEINKICIVLRLHEMLLYALHASPIPELLLDQNETAWLVNGACRVKPRNRP